MLKLGRLARLAVPVALLAMALGGAANAQNFYSISGSLDLKYAQFPNEFITGSGVAQGTGTGVVNFSIPTDFFRQSTAVFQAYPNYPSVAQVVETITTSIPSAANLAAGAGQGDLTGWCPPAGNPINPACTNPAQATAGLNGLLQYNAGPNQFGGTIKIISDTKGVTSRRIATGPSQFNHIARSSIAQWVAGGTYEATNIALRPPGVITQSPVLGPSGSIQTPGVYVGPGPTPPTIFQTGLGLTTGQIIGRDSRPTPFTLTLSGYDNRTVSGAGTIQLVGGSFFNQPAASPAQAFPGNTTITLTLPEPGALAGLVVGGAALLGLARLRRRPVAS